MTERLKPHSLAGELAAEFAGTLILILFGVGVVAQVVAGGLGGHDSIAWAWGLGVTLGVYVSARISGAHLNPAVTVALALFRGFSWAKVAPYVLAQILGAFVAALIVRWNYTEVIAKIDPGHTVKSQGIFSTLPGNGTLPVHTGGALRDQIIGTAILLFLILAVTDQYGHLYFWVPILGPLIGAPLGGALYDGLIGRHLPIDDGDQEPGRSVTDPDVDKERGHDHSHDTRPHAHDQVHGQPAVASTEPRSETRG